MWYICSFSFLCSTRLLFRFMCLSEVLSAQVKMIVMDKNFWFHWRKHYRWNMIGVICLLYLISIEQNNPEQEVVSSCRISFVCDIVPPSGKTKHCMVSIGNQNLRFLYVCASTHHNNTGNNFFNYPQSDYLRLLHDYHHQVNIWQVFTLRYLYFLHHCVSRITPWAI